MATLEEILKQISDKTGTTVEVLKTELGIILEDIKKIVPADTPEDVLSGMAINKLTSSFRKQMLSNGEKFEGIFIGATGVFDMVKKKRALILKYYAENPEDAIAQKMVEVEGDVAYPLNWEPVEAVAKMVGNMEWKKKNLGKRLPETEYRRTLYGVVKMKDGLVKLRMNIRDKNAHTLPQMFTVCDFIGYKLNSSTDELVNLNDSGLFKPIVKQELTETAVVDIFEKLYKNDFLELTQAEEFCAAHQGEFNPLMISKVNVVEISPAKTKTNSSIVNVADDSIPLDRTFTCWISEDIPLEFPESASIYIIGTPKVDGDKYSFGVSGIFVPPLYKSMVMGTKEDVGKESEIVGKW